MLGYAQRRGLSPEDLYRESLAVWAIEHQANSHDCTTAQWQRWGIFIRCVNADLDPQHLAFARHLIRTGKVRDD